MIKRCIGVTLVLIAISLAPAQAREALSVGSCPSTITLERTGVWEAAEENLQALENMRANTARKSKVAAVFVRPEDGAYFNVLGLGSLESIQGQISEPEFNRIKEAYSKNIPSSNKNDELHQTIDQLEQSSIAGTKLSQYDFSPYFVDKGNEFAIFGTTDVSVDGELEHFLTGQRMILLNGCVIALNFGMPVNRYDLGDLSSAVWEVGFR